MRESPRGIAPTAIVLGITTNGLSFVRSLGRRGTPVLMMDTPGGKPAMTSRFGTSLPMPDICAAPESWLSQLGDIARQASCPPVLIPTGDEHVLFVSQYRDELRQRFRFRIPPAGVAEMLCNKRRQYQFLIERGVLLPRTAFVDGEVDVARLAQDSVGFPCVLKPCFSHRWWRQRTGVKLEIARGADELQRAYRRMSATGESLLLQEFIPGDDRAFHGYLGYYGAAGRPLAALTKQKLRQYPPLCGNGSLQISTRNRRVAELSEYILRGLNYEGLVAIEYKLDRRDGQYKLIEINPRSVAGNQLPIDCGVDFPFIAYEDAIGAPIAPVEDYRVGVKWLHLGWDVQALLAGRRAGRLSVGEWLVSLRGVRSLAMFSVRDPWPFASYVASIGRQVLGRRRPPSGA